MLKKSCFPSLNVEFPGQVVRHSDPRRLGAEAERVRVSPGLGVGFVDSKSSNSST